MIWPLILKDLKILFSDRRAMIISMLVPIGIACFMAGVFRNVGQPSSETKLPILVVDQDGTKESKQVIENLKISGAFSVREVDAATASGETKDGKSPAALILEKGFGERVPTALFGGSKPQITMLTDPSQGTAVQAIKGTMMEPVMAAILGKEVKDTTPPFDLKEQAKVQHQDPQGATAAHVFGGMAMQGVLFFSIEAAMGIMRERKQGIWKRVRAAPVSPIVLLSARIASGALRALTILIAVLGVGALFYHMDVTSNLPGLALISVSAAIMAATFGLFVAALGRNEQQSRGLSIFVVLLMVMLGGAWIPSFMMPEWVQKIAVVIPVKWAVDGFDAMTWRGGGMAAAGTASGVLLGFALAFAIFALTRFRWDAETS